MPDRSAHYAWVSETNSWVPSEPERGKSAGVGTWLGAKVLGAVGWLMGIEPFDPIREDVKGDVEKGEKQAMLLREGRGSEGMAGQRMSSGHDMRIYSPLDMDNPSSPVHHSTPPPLAHDPQRYKGLFSGISRPSGTRSSSQPTSPLLRPQSSTPECSNSPELSHEAASEYDEFFSQHEHLHQQLLSDEQEKPLPPAPHSHSRTGSSGSTGGSLVYVRMSDGRLVRKLSTIASEASEATSGHRGMASGSASGGRISRQTSGSWATALDREEVVEHEQLASIGEADRSTAEGGRLLRRGALASDGIH